MSPAAIAKAQSLHRFATRQGAPLSTFKLALTTDEALEVLDWFKDTMTPNVMFDADLKIAHRTGNPWEMVTNFQLLGLDIVRVN